MKKLSKSYKVRKNHYEIKPEWVHIHISEVYRTKLLNMGHNLVFTKRFCAPRNVVSLVEEILLKESMSTREGVFVLGTYIDFTDDVNVKFENNDLMISTKAVIK